MNNKIITIRSNQVVGAREAVMHYLKSKTLTSFEAWDLWGITRLAVIICNLRKEGYPIDTVKVEHTNKFGTKGHYARYKYINPTK